MFWWYPLKHCDIINTKKSHYFIEFFYELINEQWTLNKPFFWWKAVSCVCGECAGIFCSDILLYLWRARYSVSETPDNVGSWQQIQCPSWFLKIKEWQCKRLKMGHKIFETFWINWSVKSIYSYLYSYVIIYKMCILHCCPHIIIICNNISA